jgi:hypothetical protein
MCPFPSPFGNPRSASANALTRGAWDALLIIPTLPFRKKQTKQKKKKNKKQKNKKKRQQLKMH